MACKAYRDLAYEQGIKYPEMYAGFFFPHRISDMF